MGEGITARRVFADFGTQRSLQAHQGALRSALRVQRGPIGEGLLVAPADSPPRPCLCVEVVPPRNTFLGPSPHFGGLFPATTP